MASFLSPHFARECAGPAAGPHGRGGASSLLRLGGPVRLTGMSTRAMQRWIAQVAHLQALSAGGKRPIKPVRHALWASCSFGRASLWQESPSEHRMRDTKTRTE
jgi:hypothetical protein